MVTVFFRGGLGNQMFQYALGLNLAKKNNTELFLDTVHVSDRFPRTNFTHRTFDLPDVFEVAPRFTALSRVASAVPIPGVWLGLDLLGMNIKERLGGRKILYEDERKGFDAGVLDARGNLILYGRFENEKYFSDVADEVRAAFHFRHTLDGVAAEVAREIARVNSISLHVRRGDFVGSKKVEKIMGKTGAPYYERAADHVAAYVKDPHFFIFSDDIAWCKENIKLRYPATYVESNSAGPKGAHHLQLMSLCKSHIIANSTFSWWGAWLDPNPRKIVIAPKQWLADEKFVREVVPENWVKF